MRCSRTITIGLLLSFAFLIGVEGVSGQTKLLHFTTEESVILRWIDPNPSGADGYNIYRMDEGGAWERLNSAMITRVYSERKIEEVAGYKTDLYLGLVGAETPRDLTDADYRRAFASDDASLLRVLLLLHPEFGVLLGELYQDDVAPGRSVRYRIERVAGSRTNVLVESEAIVTGQAEEVPGVSDPLGAPGDRQATISWQKVQSDLDAGRVLTWNVYRADSPLGPFLQMNTTGISSFTLVGDGEEESEQRGTYVDEWLENGRSYYYQIRSVNPFGFESAASATIKVVPAASQPSPPTGLLLRRSGDHLLVSWDVDSGQTSGIVIYRRDEREADFTELFEAPPLDQDEATAFWIDTDIEEGVTYHYYLRMVGDGADGPLTSLPSDTLVWTFEDHTPPSAPTGLRATGGADGIALDWTPNPETDVIGYEVERAGDDAYETRGLLNGEMIDSTSWRDVVASDIATTFGYVVYAIDRSYNRSAPSSMVFAAMPDIVAPQQPIITRLEARADSVEISWTSSPDRDLASWTLYRATGEGPLQRLASIAGPLTGAMDLPPTAGRYRYAVAALDSTGNESEQSTAVVIEVRRERTLPAPTGLTIVEKEGHLLLAWDAVSDAAGYTITHVDRASGRTSLLEESDAATTTYRDTRETRLRPGTYIIRARDSEWVFGLAGEVVFEGG